MQKHTTILVIGAGVSGLTSAICLAEAGLKVRVRTTEHPRETTSCAAGAIWGPYLVDDDRVLRWSERTRTVLCGLADEAASGVRMIHGLEASRLETPPPDWAAELDAFRPSRADELPDGFRSGWWYTAPVVEMPAYLDYLTKRFLAAGGQIEVGTAVESLAEAVARAPIVVNCSGLGARDLVPDPEVIPVRGQLVVVENPGVDTFFVEHDESAEPIYFLPHGDHVVLGGSTEPHRTDRAPDLATSAAIQKRCAGVHPALGEARVLDHRVGLRPSRPRIRVECSEMEARYVIHNYGHGGAGVTVSWGCAQSVLTLVSAL